ncbi:MAG: nickel transporter [Pseudomonadota bacterium]
MAKKSVLLLLMLIGVGCGTAFANPFGSVVPSEPVPGFGFANLIAWTASAQAVFYDGLTSALRQVSSSPSALALLLGLSFAYGVVHAAGPGHGKVVIGSYMLASGETARRGALLAIGAAMVQATMAVALVGLLAGLFNLSRSALSSTTITLERFSYGLVIVLGLYLLYRAARRLAGRKTVAEEATLPVHGHNHHHDHHGHDHAHEHAHDHSHDHHDHDHGAHCDHVHIPDAQSLKGSQGFAQTAMLILGAGARPCTGALLVLVLALSQGLFWAGSAAAYAMGVGTALTVGMLAVLAGALARFIDRRTHSETADASRVLRWMPHVLSFGGGVLIVGFGALLLAASLAR